MKILLTLFVLLFSSSVMADDISDFEIEGMSIGDSLLDYFSEEEIIKEKKNSFIFKDNEFIIIDFKKSIFKTYETIQIYLKPNDKNYIIYGVEGLIESFSTISECLKLKEEVVDELSLLFKNTAKKTIKNFNHQYDKTGNTKVYYVFFDLKLGGSADVGCIDWSKELEIKEGWKDDFHVLISNSEFTKYLNNNPY